MNSYDPVEELFEDIYALPKDTRLTSEIAEAREKLAAEKKRFQGVKSLLDEVLI